MSENRRSTSSARSTGSVGDFNEPGLSSDEVTDDDIISVDTAAGDNLSVEHVELESMQLGPTDTPRSLSPRPQRSRSPKPPRSSGSKISSASEKSLTDQKVNYVELQWGKDGLKDGDKAEEKE